MKYCPKCGSELVSKLEGGRERPACEACGYIFFGEFSVGCGGVVLRDGQALLIRRGHDPGRGWWQIPGGYAEVGESPAAACQRRAWKSWPECPGFRPATARADRPLVS